MTESHNKNYLSDSNRTHLLAIITRNNYRFAVTKPYREINGIVDWCKEEISNDWHWTVVTASGMHQDGEYIFEFTTEKDAVAFSLKWIS